MAETTTPPTDRPTVLAESTPVAPQEGLLARLQRHKVIQWTLAYAAAAYTMMHASQMIGEAFDWPRVVARVLTLLFIAGAPLVATLAWYHGAKGLKRVTVGELAIITLLGLIAGSALWAFTGIRGEPKPLSATTVASQPTSVAASAIGAPRTAVAVMPFANETGDEKKDYLGEGMATELINILTKVPGLMVPSQTSSFAYRGRNADIRQIGRDLGVGTILEGAVQTAGDRIRITADLIDAGNGLHLWSETYDRQFADLFKLQDDLASSIVRALQVNLGGHLPTAVSSAPPTRNVAAYDLYLQAYAIFDRSSVSNFLQAQALLRQALALDPAFARAYGLMAGTHLGLFSVFGLPSVHFLQAEQFARQALAIDPNDDGATMALPQISSDRGQWLETARLDRAASAGNDGHALVLYAIRLARVGHVHDAIREALKAYALAPASGVVCMFVAEVYSAAGSDPDAVKYADLARELGVAAPLLGHIYAAAAWRSGQYTEAARFEAADFAPFPDESRAAKISTLVYKALAHPEKRGEAVSAGLKLYPEDRTLRPVNSVKAIRACTDAVLLYVRLGVLDAAYRLMNRCLAEQPPEAAMLGEATNWLWRPEMRPFRQDPRFQNLAQRLGLIAYWRQYGPPDDCDLPADKLTCH